MSSSELQQANSLWEDQTYSSDINSKHLVTESRRKLIELYQDCSQYFIDYTESLIYNGQLSTAEAVESTLMHIGSNQEEVKKIIKIERWLASLYD